MRLVMEAQAGEAPDTDAAMLYPTSGRADWLCRMFILELVSRCHDCDRNISVLHVLGIGHGHALGQNPLTSGRRALALFFSRSKPAIYLLLT